MSERQFTARYPDEGLSDVETGRQISKPNPPWISAVGRRLFWIGNELSCSRTEQMTVFWSCWSLERRWSTVQCQAPSIGALCTETHVELNEAMREHGNCV